ncbi:DUF4350 domain-containing protein [Natronobacterium gregoryi]|uniref:GATase domain protein n=2 Tax=Natronobacterium gregoryi TaxID=44930 RepID=L0AII9_NATGS|nr:DUF4350 domain-containing protein [Natronobacterium gregoryi]AFZ73596.1 hypothetical protein Natgr_2428 [Natronobacterium gregoryi SP2]ELY68158.1 hypothetical protein C490_10285 [Natronobacterium gregoryi SP2]PLK20017.1 hypothetical protein CYV19_11910 [Natronobacterium gregoryi SP2]SFJ34732.1 hypothetical protein SAMN05443661_12343 [Natronobacterium gregoryi]
MNGDEIRSRLVVFAVVVLLAVTAVAAAGVITNQGSTEKPTVDQVQFQPENVDAPELERGGEISIDVPTGTETVVIDTAHANDVSKDDLQPVVSTLVADGNTVEYFDSESGGLSASPEERENELAETLEDADAYIVVEPNDRYTPGEAEIVSDFADADGRVLFVGGPDAGGGALLGLLGPMGTDTGDDGEFESVTSQFGIAYDTGYLYDMQDYENNYQTLAVTPAAETDLTDGVDHVVFDGPTQVATAGQPLLTTSPTAEHSESRETGEYPVAAQNDNAVAVGDTGFMTSENYNVADNEVFISNILEFLVSGNATPGNLGTADSPAHDPGGSNVAGSGHAEDGFPGAG